jgi:hypothetical protein
LKKIRKKSVTLQRLHRNDSYFINLKKKVYKYFRVVLNTLFWRKIFVGCDFIFEIVFSGTVQTPSSYASARSYSPTSPCCLFGPAKEDFVYFDFIVDRVNRQRPQTIGEIWCPMDLRRDCPIPAYFLQQKVHRKICVGILHAYSGVGVE